MAVLVLLLYLLLPAEPPRVGAVTAVADGDTLTIQLENGPARVRLLGIDAPERNQPGGQEAREALQALVLGQVVRFVPDDEDRYGRIVGTIYVGERDINAELIQQGHAWAYREYLGWSNRHYIRLEDEARKARRGLWADGNPVPPWDWRDRKR